MKMDDFMNELQRRRRTKRPFAEADRHNIITFQVLSMEIVVRTECIKIKAKKASTKQEIIPNYALCLV